LESTFYLVILVLLLKNLILVVKEGKSVQHTWHTNRRT